jgi:hypothetical protein
MTETTPSSEELADLIRRCEDDGAAKERARIVDWLKNLAKEQREYDLGLSDRSDNTRRLAYRIEDGAHVRG